MTLTLACCRYTNYQMVGISNDGKIAVSQSVAQCFGSSFYSSHIGVIVDDTISMIPYVVSLCKAAFYYLRSIACLREYLSPRPQNILFQRLTIVINSLLFGVPQYVLRKCQCIQNAATHVISLESMITKCRNSLQFTAYLLLKPSNSR